jgi:hypothetical protein
MSQCCGGHRDPSLAPDAPDAWFRRMIDHCHEYALQAKASGRPIVGILCEFTPREILMAAGAVPVCLCGGSAATIPAAEEHLPANLCPLIKSTYGYHLLRSNPLLELADLVVAETTCDGKKKMYELMAQSRATYVLELPQKAREPESLEQWVAELRKFRRFVESRWNVDVSDDKLRAAIEVMNRERRLRRDLAALLQADPPPLGGRDLLDFKSSISRSWAKCPMGRPAPRALDRRSHRPRRGAGAGDHRKRRRRGGRHGKLHRLEADPGRRRCRGRRSASCDRREVLPSALLGDDPQ